MRKELKPCPFCGGKAILTDGKSKAFGTFEALVICKDCSASVVGISSINFATRKLEENGYDLAKEQAIKAWNRRADMPTCNRNRFVELPCAVKDLIDKVIGHNEIVAIWERRKNKEGRYHALLWKGMAWDIPEEYLERTFFKIFGTVPESITESDTVNIAVTPILISVEEAEQALKECEKC